MTFKSKTAAFVAGVAGFAVALSFVVTPVTASAQSVSDLQAQIAALLAQIAQLQGMVGGGSTSTGGSAPVAPLTLGSSGAQVTALQNWLIMKGYSIPAGATGYFGAQTQSAVAAFQAANGISPAAGYYGPVTAAKVASMMGPTTPGTTPGTTPVLNGSDGSVTVSFNPFAPTSQTLKKGETKDVISVKLQATSGDVNVTRFDVHTDKRPWLYFTKFTLHDQNGNVLATKTLNSASDATEINVGSDYLVRFDGINSVVRPGSDIIYVVSATVSNDSDKITGDPVLYFAIPTGAIRTINGRGYTDSVGIGSTSQGGAPTSTYGNAATLSSSGSTGAIYTRISPSTPLQRIVTTNASSQTPDVVLGVFGVKSQNRGGTVNALNVILNTSGTDAAHLYSNVRLCDGSMCYGANSLATTTTFTNMTLNLSEDVWKDLTLKADVLSGISSVSASSTLDASTISGVDTNYNTFTISGSDVTSNDVTYLTSGISIANPTASVGSAIVQNNSTVGYNATFSFTVQNTSNNDVYMSKAPGVMLATSSAASTGGSTASSTITTVTASPDTYAGDTSSAYSIPAGASRSFVFTARLSPVAGGGAQTADLKITAVYFGTTSGATTANSITFGLSALRATASF